MSKKAKSKSKVKGETQRLAAKRRKELEMQKQLDLEDEIEEVLDDSLMEEDIEPLEKSDMGEMPMMNETPYIGATSFEELDAERKAEEQAQKTREVTWDVQDLVRNILRDPLTEPKSKAGKIQAVASEFEARVANAIQDIQKDMDVLEIEAILAAEERDRSRTPLKKAAESAVDFLKETLSGGARKELPDSAFALPKKRKYPIHDKAHVRNALARAAQQIKAGGEAAADARAALPRIRAAAKKFGITVGVEKGIHIEKDAKGDWRWIGRPSNNFVDWQGDIMSRESHQKYTAWLDENPEMAPQFMKWHTAGTARENPVDFWMEHEGALIMSGILTEDEAAQILRMQKQVDLGMSVQGIGMRLNKENPHVITDYWLYEVSDLPLEKAANPFTSLETITKEAGMDKLEYLTEMMGSEERAKAYLKKTGQMQADLQATGITSKEKAEEKPATGDGQTETPETPEALDVKKLVTELAKQLKDELDIDGLNEFVAQAQEDHEKVNVLEGLVKELRQSDDEKLAAQLTAPAARYAWSRNNRPSQSKKTKLEKGAQDDEEEDEDETLLKALPGVDANYWLSQVTGTAPISEEV